MPDELGGAVGIERWELLQKAKGDMDPFLLDGIKLTHGTKDKPTIIRSVCDTRTIGCVCDDDATTVRYIELCMGETRRCQCGHFFKLVDADAEV
ncbi:COX5B [Bugula neritina]|uniref:COX5B n=1 Tax=Bugula neritina TaxID=10212 RepID=A0A7J7KQN6_BUGNE|nr:COX5B [Bugula neritina]